MSENQKKEDPPTDLQILVLAGGYSERFGKEKVISSIPHIESKYLVVATCDCPKISPKVLKMIYEKAVGHDGSVPIWPNEYIEPLQATYQVLSVIGLFYFTYTHSHISQSPHDP
ncbi:hypothetical protein AKJ48_01155 [candidate division MSBL1 archaeon SCGC-AAA261O19]|uniref:MobA-like NTP transferase domain-containing protein n=1 Tax=candidate division MSBL1 archaeon SCGC-AAA261O19 TaxID=1698277 RepID=A0A133VEQ0_9EURY|nr:hypothetical protein AKJ48_01155 [candidate division MSBL1 archaeon SCGC-AAA261O19]